MKKVLVSLMVIAMVTTSVFAGEWIQNGDGWQYQDDNGEFITSQQKKIDGKYYYFDDAGFVLTGYQEIDGSFYVFNDDGTPKSEPITFNGKTYNVTGKGKINSINKTEFEQLIENAFVVNTGALTGDLDYAKKLVDTLPISRYQLRLILTNQGMTTDKIDFVMTNINVNWKDQAVKCAKQVLTYGEIRKVELKKLLTSVLCLFTDSEASYAVEVAVSDEKMASAKSEQDIQMILSRYQQEMIGLANNVKK